jgi:hypothetical protein
MNDKPSVGYPPLLENCRNASCVLFLGASVQRTMITMKRPAKWTKARKLSTRGSRLATKTLMKTQKLTTAIVKRVVCHRSHP